MFPSLGLSRSPFVGPPPLRVPPLKWHWWLDNWIPDVLHRRFKPRSSSVELDSERYDRLVEWSLMDLAIWSGIAR
jgi:hypothetical protein